LNDGGIDQDFRVESVNNDHMLFVNAGLDQVAIGTNAITAPSGYQFFSYGAGSGARSAFVHGAGDGGIVVSGAAASSAASVIFGNNWGTNGATFSEEYRLFMDGADDSLKFNYNANASTAMELASNGFVSIGGDSPITPLHVKYSGSGELLRLESTDAGLGDGPIIGLFRNSASPADGDGLGAINFYGEDSVSNITTYAQIRAEASDVTNGTEDGLLSFRTIVGGSDTARLNLTLDESVFNQNGVDLDFRVESDTNTHALFVDALGEFVTVGSNVNYVAGKLFVNGNIKVNYNDEISMQYNVSGQTSTYHKGMTGTSPETTSARGLHIFNYDSDSDEGIKFYSGAPSGTAYQKVNFKAGQTGEIVFNDNSYDQDFRVESNDNTHLLFVDGTNNRLAVNNSDPKTLVDIYDATLPVLRLTNGRNEVAGSDYDLGKIEFFTRDSSGTGQRVLTEINAIADAGSTAPGGIFTIKTAVTNSAAVERVRFDAGHEVVFNDTGTDTDFRVESDTNSHAFFVDAGNGALTSGGTSLGGYNQTSGNGSLAYLNDNGSVFGSLILSSNADRGWSLMYANKFEYTSGDDARYIAWYVNGGALANLQLNAAGTQVEYNTGSDRRLKENIVDIDDGIVRLKQMQPRKYTWVGTDLPAEGFIADEADGIVPEAVKGEVGAVDDEGNPIYQQIEYSRYVPLLTAALKEAVAKIEALEARVAQLETN
jgi:hypothetical protein